jgi:hypothetical protein
VVHKRPKKQPEYRAKQRITNREIKSDDKNRQHAGSKKAKLGSKTLLINACF